MASLARRASNRLIQAAFPYLERYLGIHVTPVHYYSPIPTTYEIGNDIYEERFTCGGIDWNDADQLTTLDKARSYAAEYQPAPNTGLSLLDAMMLYTFIRDRKPRTMIEIGSGVTTGIAMDALRKNREEGHPFQFTAKEPFPSAQLRALSDPNFTLRVQPVQQVELNAFCGADLLFIDSTHVSRIGSDVNYEVLEIIPALPSGCLVHWHDIAMPMNYWKDWIQSGNQFWNESYLVHALLMYNRVLSIKWAAHYMKLTHMAELSQAFPTDWAQRRLSSLWVEKL
jgi:hypothetical protein